MEQGKEALIFLRNRTKHSCTDENKCLEFLIASSNLSRDWIPEPKNWLIFIYFKDSKK